jgi:hypothetical protein
MREDHGDGKSKHTAKHQQRDSQPEIRKRSRRSKMEIAAYALIAVATLLGIITSAVYSTHRVLSIVLFGITFLLVDVSICLFWAAKTAPTAPAAARMDKIGKLPEETKQTPQTAVDFRPAPPPVRGGRRYERPSSQPSRDQSLH